LEIEYAYSPRYHLGGKGVVDVDRFYVNGWIVHETELGGVENDGVGYLGFVRSTEDNVVNWASTPESAVTTGLAGGDFGSSTIHSSRDYIVVRGSDRWNGLHEVQEATANHLLTKTVVSIKDTVPFWTAQQVDFATDETIFDGGAGTLWLADHFSTNDYVWITGSESGKNNGLFSISSTTQSSTAASSKLTLGTRYSVVNSADSDSSSTGLNNEYSAAAALTGETDQSDIKVYKAFRDFCYIDTNIPVLNDELDTIDLPEYLAKALVYYVKAKIAEDGMDLEQKEYYMREFNRIIEKHESSKVWGARIMVPGSHGIR
jgi:hypothetical protein